MYIQNMLWKHEIRPVFASLWYFEWESVKRQQPNEGWFRSTYQSFYALQKQIRENNNFKDILQNSHQLQVMKCIASYNTLGYLPRELQTKAFSAKIHRKLWKFINVWHPLAPSETS